MVSKLLEILARRNLFLTGGGGVGKSHLVRAIIDAYKARSLGVVVLGSTAISAVNIGGVTLHSFFKIGVCDTLDELKVYDANKPSRLRFVRQLLGECDLIVIDEISMVSASLLDIIHYRLSASKSRARLLFVGDFYQLPPVKKTGGFAFESAAWREFNPLCVELTKSKRTSDAELFSALSKARVGVVDDEVCEFFASRTNQPIPDGATMLFGTKNQVAELNAAKLAALQTQGYEIDARVKKIDTKLTDQEIEKWTQNLRSPQTLRLKIGAKVMFCANKPGEYYNGEQGRVIAAQNGCIVVRKDDGETANVEPLSTDLIEYKSSGGKVSEVVRASFVQFPLTLAYGITIHKSQGMSLPLLVCDLNRIFEKAQAYVALSRATSSAGLFLQCNWRRQGCASFAEFLRRVITAEPRVREFYEGCERVFEEDLAGLDVKGVADFSGGLFGDLDVAAGETGGEMGAVGAAGAPNSNLGDTENGAGNGGENGAGDAKNGAGNGGENGVDLDEKSRINAPVNVSEVKRKRAWLRSAKSLIALHEKIAKLRAECAEVEGRLREIAACADYSGGGVALRGGRIEVEMLEKSDGEKMLAAAKKAGKSSEK